MIPSLRILSLTSIAACAAPGSAQLPVVAADESRPVTATDADPSLAATGSEATSHWNQWRGPQRTGAYTGPAWPARVQADNLTRAWRIPLGKSYSGPVLDAKRVFTTETVDGTHEVVRALDRATGEAIWSRRWAGATKVPFFAARNGSWIRSTPTVDGERLFVAGMRDVLVCLATDTGEEIWRVDFAKKFKTAPQSFGFVCSPLVHGDFVYVQVASGLMKLEKQTGKLVWHSLKEKGGMFGGAFSSPVVATLREREQLLVQTRTSLHGVGITDGDSLWKVNVKTFRGMNILTPTVFGDSVLTSAYGGRGHLFRVTETDDELGVEEAWTNRAQGYMTSPVIIDGFAYLYLRSKRLGCFRVETGEMAWISKPIGDTYWSMVANGDRILALGDAGDLYLVAANPKEYELIDRHTVSESETWAHLAIDAGRLFIRELDGLVAYDWQ